MTGNARVVFRRGLVVACAVSLLLAGPVIATTSPPGPHMAMMGASAAGAPDAARAVPQVQAAPAPTTPARAAPRRGLAAAATAAAEAAAADSTDLGVAVLDRATGEMSVGTGGEEPFYTASLSKVVVAVDALDRRRLEGLAVTEEDLGLFRRALGPSDDSAMNALWSRFDGAGAASRLRARIGLSSGTTDPRDPSQWGEMSVPAADTVRIWQHILDDIPTADRDVLVSALDAAPGRARDGFDQSYGLLSEGVDGSGGAGAVAKQGWMCCFSGRYYLHSAGAVGPAQRFVVTLLARVPRGPGWEASRQELDRIAAATVQSLS